MNKHKIKRDQFLHSQLRRCVSNLLAAMLGVTLLSIAPVYAVETQAGMQNILLAAVTPKKISSTCTIFYRDCA